MKKLLREKELDVQRSKHMRAAAFQREAAEKFRQDIAVKHRYHHGPVAAQITPTFRKL